MSKRIVFCADGTWDDSTKQTNVSKLFRSLPVSANQMPFYDDGVGADGDPLTKLVGGAFGTGLWQKVKAGYTNIAQVYEAGDPLFLFGFSRGAYTARSLAGMIAVCGLPTKNFDDELVETAFTAYRDKDRRQALLDSLKDAGMHDAQITMIGVWDTVGALGIPSAVGGVDPALYGFLDTGLHPDVRNAYQALAIDEQRIEFPPTLWTSPPAAGQNIEQLWFCGVHSDVGGGEPSDGPGTTALSDITLAWMMDKAKSLGLEFDGDVAAKYALPLDAKYTLDTLHTSWNVLWGFPKKRAIAADATLANSVAVRTQHDGSYRPSNLVFANGSLSPGYQIRAVVAEPELT
jgi:uncharacterized protein (DUF2235 family)